jgi:hypothetical protein
MFLQIALPLSTFFLTKSCLFDLLHWHDPKAESGSICPWTGGAQPMAPVSQCYTEEVWPRLAVRDSPAPPHTPPTTLATEGALERREAPPSPPRTSTFIARTRCHRPRLRRFSTAALTEPATPLLPLRQAEDTPATSTDMMANIPAASPSLPDGL